MLKVGLIGYGYWGEKLARCVSTLKNAELKAICDINPDRKLGAAAKYGVTITSSLAIACESCDAVIIALRPADHFQAALECLKAGKHVLVEKPLTLNSVDANALLAIAERRRLVLAVDSTYLHSEPMKMLCFSSREYLGNLDLIDSVRVSTRDAIRDDVDILQELAHHDFSVLDYLLGTPREVSATASKCAANVVLLYSGGLRASVRLSWLDPVRQRKMVFIGKGSTVVWDDCADSPLVQYSKGTSRVIPVSDGEALLTSVKNFVDCCVTGGTPISDGKSGLRVVQLIEAARRSAHNGGAPEKL